jgi:predicted DNA-binding WGR domain protein
MERERYIARRIQHWHVVRIGENGQETVMEITDSEEAAKAEADRLDREAERGTDDKPPQTS